MGTELRILRRQGRSLVIISVELSTYKIVSVGWDAAIEFFSGAGNWGKVSCHDTLQFTMKKNGHCVLCESM
jgi:hypothetical protein